LRQRYEAEASFCLGVRDEILRTVTGRDIDAPGSICYFTSTLLSTAVSLRSSESRFSSSILWSLMMRCAGIREGRGDHLSIRLPCGGGQKSAKLAEISRRDVRRNTFARPDVPCRSTPSGHWGRASLGRRNCQTCLFRKSRSATARLQLSAISETRIELV